jgi:ABC-type spermidine/putrescine transport system permease subunit I
MADNASSLSIRATALLLLPLCALLLLVLVYPLLVTAWTSVYDHGMTLRGYRELAESALFRLVLVNTFVISVSAMLAALLAGYPVALHISRQPARRRTLYLILVMMPFWTSILVKSFALGVVFGSHGLINRAFAALSDGRLNVAMMYNRAGVIIGMVNYLLPFVVLSVLGSLLSINPKLGLAAETMGASPLRTFWRITFPLSLPGVISGAFMAFTLSVGMYITPALLGGRRDMMIANLVDFYTRQNLDWTLASASAIVLLAISGVLVGVLGAVRRFGDPAGRSA